MNLSNSKRISKLLGSLIKQPNHAVPYVRCHPWRGKGPIDYRLPWWSFDAIEAVSMFCTGKEFVFEYGSGGSTLFFAERCACVTAVEDNESWFQTVYSRAARENFKNIQLVAAPFDFRDPKDFENSTYLHSLGSRKYNIIVIDGQDWSFNERLVCFARAEKFIESNGLIIVDDSWRYEVLRKKNRAKKIHVCEGVGPCRIGVTSTDLYYY